MNTNPMFRGDYRFRNFLKTSMSSSGSAAAIIKLEVMIFLLSVLRSYDLSRQLS